MPKTARINKADKVQEEQPPLLPADKPNSRLTLLLKEYLQADEIESIWDAYRLSKKAHKGQKRRSGEDYITHPVSVACIAAKFHLDAASIQAALLHDVVEDTATTIEQIADQFGTKVAELVFFLTDISKPEDGNRAFRKQLDAEHNATGPAEAQTIKVADLIHNSSDIAAHDPRFWKTYKTEKLQTLNLLDKADTTLKARAFAQIMEGK